MGIIEHYTVSTRRGLPVVEGWRPDNSLIHVYFSEMKDDEIVCAETGARYKLRKPKQ